MKLIKAIIMSAVFFAGVTQAHTELYDSKPAAGSEVNVSPEELFLSFSGDVRVIKLKLTDGNGKQVDFGFKPVVDAASELTWPLPELKAGSYQVEWTVMGEDGHTFQNSYAFSVASGHGHHNMHDMDKMKSAHANHGAH